MAQFDASEVFALMKRRGFVPAGATAFTETEFIAEVAAEIETSILPALIKANTKHLLATQDQTVVAGTSAYRVPDRCANNGVYSVWLVNASQGLDQLDEIDPGDVPKLGINLNSGTPIFFAFEGPNIVLYPTPLAAGKTLRIKYQIRPNRLVLVNTCGLISAVAATTVTVNALPTNTSGPYDFIRGKGSYEHLGIDQVGSRASNTVTIPGGIPTGTAIGDWVCNVQESPVPQLPTGLHLPAAMRGVAAILASKGNRDQAKWLKDEAAMMEKQVLEALVPRNQTMQQSLVNPWW